MQLKQIRLMCAEAIENSKVINTEPAREFARSISHQIRNVERDIEDCWALIAAHVATQIEALGVRVRLVPVTPRERLTSREREIVQLLAEGKSSKEVASSLCISVKTVETHRSNIMRKLSIHTVTDLVRYAVRNQIIEP
jgi:DNA-binding NarL/FixJ family response regulator